MLGLAACANDDGAGADSSTDSTLPEAPAVLELIDPENGANVSIVYSVSAQEYELDTATAVSDRIYRMTEVRIRPEAEPVEPDPERCEILVGMTSYDESKEVYASLGYGEGAVKVVGNKIVLAGYSASALSQALDELAAAMAEGKTEEGVYTVSNSLFVTASDNELLAEVPVADGFTAGKITDTGDGCYMLTFESVSAEKMQSYVATFENKGYTKYDENKIDDNLFYTYVSEENVLTAMYTKYNSTARVLIQPKENTALPTREADNVYTPVEGCETTITQLGLYYDYGDNKASAYFNGMCYVIRLADGSFIVVDGGHNKSIDGDRIYNVLRKQAPDPDNIVIAAWVFSHAHSDHVGFFKDFAKTYSTKVTVEQFIFNFPSAEQRAGLSDNRGVVDVALKQYFANVPIVKAHAGQVYHLRNAKLTMLYSLDLYTDTLTDYNNTSLVFTVEAEGQKFMVFGDYSENGKTMRSMYSADTFKSDIMQVSHHGVAGQSTETYELVAPEYALWPAGDYFVSFTYNGTVQNVQLNEKSWNQYMIQKMDQDKVLWALDDIVILTLGADGITSQVFENDTAYLSGSAVSQ